MNLFKNVTSQLLLASSLVVAPAAFSADTLPAVDPAIPAVAPKVEEKVKSKEKHTSKKVHNAKGKSGKAKSTKVDAALEKMPHNQEKTEQPVEQKIGE